LLGVYKDLSGCIVHMIKVCTPERIKCKVLLWTFVFQN